MLFSIFSLVRWILLLVSSFHGCIALIITFDLVENFLWQKMALWSWAVGSVFLELKALRLLSNVEQGAFKSFLGKWASLLKAIACLELALIIILIVGIFLNTVMAFAYVIGFVLYLFAILFTFGLILLSEDANDRFMYYPKRFFYWQNQFIKALNFHQEDLVVLVLIVMWVFPLVLSVSIVSFANKISRKT